MAETRAKEWWKSWIKWLSNPMEVARQEKCQRLIRELNHNLMEVFWYMNTWVACWRIRAWQYHLRSMVFSSAIFFFSSRLIWYQIRFRNIFFFFCGVFYTWKIAYVLSWVLSVSVLRWLGILLYLVWSLCDFWDPLVSESPVLLVVLFGIFSLIR